MFSKKILDEARIDILFNEDISSKTAKLALKIKVYNCNTCEYFITSCKFPGIKTQYEMQYGNRIFAVCEKYKQKEK